MATEKRLIDANDVYSLFGTNGMARLYVGDIDLIPRVDAVEVVRCKDCCFYDPDCEYCQFWQGVRHPEHYCGEGDSYGK